MPKYEIHVEYRTGDSNGSHDTSLTLPMEWENLDNAKAALKRIREHWDWYDGRDSFEVRYNKKAPPVEPEWHKGLEEHTLRLVLDNGGEVQFWADWCGYFERLYGASVEIVQGSDGMSFDTRWR